MNKHSLVFILTNLLIVEPTFAALSQDEAKTREAVRTNVYEFRDYLMHQLSALPKGSTPIYQAQVPKDTKFTASQYNEAAKSDWAKARVMDGLTTLSRELSKTAGTAFALNSAKELDQRAVELKKSDDADFQKIGALYTQQAAALRTGDIATSDRIANQVSAMPKPTVAPSYHPSTQENSLVTAFNLTIVTAISAFAGALGALAISVISNYLGFGNSGSFMGIGQKIGSALVPSQASGTTPSNSGAPTAQAGGTAAIGQIQEVPVQPRQSQDSSNSGGAPSAQ